MHACVCIYTVVLVSYIPLAEYANTLIILTKIRELRKIACYFFYLVLS